MSSANGQALAPHERPSMGNPIIPGYFADPTVRKIGDTYYIYATTDGNGWGAGPSQVWTSKDFVNWTIQPMNWPNTHWYWAPEMTPGYDGRYYLYYSQPVQLYGAVSDSPVGPWSPLQPEGEALVPNYKIPGVITLDGQAFRDDDGKIYLYWGTWGIYPDHGCAVGLLNPDMKTFADIKLIPNTDATDFFEAPFVFKRKGIYYFMYSSGRCEDDTYRVQYAMSKHGPMGPFVYPEAHNPVLSTNSDGTVHGPGHHSILQEGDQYYIIYHRHNNPHSGGGFHRQVAADRMEFDHEGNIVKVVPTHGGVGYLGENTIPYKNLAFGAKVTASSAYSEAFSPQFAVDDNNGTLWKAADNQASAWLQLDLGEVKAVRTIHTQFEYATWYYGYVIEYSADGATWQTFSNRRDNRRWGSPMIDEGDVRARYLRMTIDQTQVPGMFKAIWNIKVFAEAGVGRPVLSDEQPLTPRDTPGGLLIDVDAAKLPLGSMLTKLPNNGSLAGEWNAEGAPYVAMLAGRQAVIFDGKTAFRSSFAVPTTLSGNSSHTVSAWVFNPTVERHEPLLAWTQGAQDLSRGIVGYGHDRGNGAVVRGAWPDVAYQTVPEAGQWHHIAVTFDGYMERLYVDGTEVNTSNKMLLMNAARAFMMGKAFGESDYFSGALSSLKVYDRALSAAEVIADYQHENTSKALVWLRADELAFGAVSRWENEGVLGGDLQVASGTLKASIICGRIAAAAERPVTIQAAPVAEAFGQKQDQDATLMVDFCITGKKSALYGISGIGHQLNIGQWGQLVVMRKDGLAHVYVNDQPVKVQQDQLNRYFVDIETGLFSLNDMAVASIRVFEGAWTNEQLAANGYQEMQVGTCAWGAAVFEVPPMFINENTVFMRAEAIDGVGMQYQFVDSIGNVCSGWLDRTDFLVVCDNADRIPAFQVVAKDRYGYVTKPTNPIQAGTRAVASPADFAVSHDFLDDGVVGTHWDGISGDRDAFQTVSSGGGELQLSSVNTQWNGSRSTGPFLYREVSGDFVAQTELDDVSGRDERRGSPNETGIMLSFEGTDGRQHLLQSSVMTGWNVGNLVTVIDGRGRRQQNNGRGWSFHRHLQLQRLGSTIYLRSSEDGRNWQELPGSPYHMDSLVGNKPVHVGLYQVTNENKQGYGTFKSFTVFKSQTD
ncbi:family 43 glycosylhydrolase [Parapedobacter luteus]|uniref:family 43 glycosylhydrolase n=1 Tax=Parapedobacter luteus TaxID=623280 RepID=UPI00159077C2|nr:family 43 glycosylhydrolase [Parapedobacter luteus]